MPTRGNTTYVDNTEDHITTGVDAGFVGGTNLMVDQYESIKILINDYKGLLDASMLELTNLTAIDLPSGWEHILDDVIIDEIDPITDDGERDPVPVLNLPDDWPSEDEIPILGVLKEAPVIDLDYTAPTLPEEEDPNIDYVQGSYDSVMWDALFEAIYDGIVNGGTGLADDVEAALFARARDRQRVTNDREYKRAMDSTGSSGFNFANGAQASILLESAAEMAQQDENINNDIMIKQAELAQINTHFMLDKGMAVESMLRQFFNETENRSLESKKVMAQFVLQKYSEKIKAYIAQWDGIIKELDAKVSVLEVVIKENQMIVQAFGAEMTGYTARVELIAKKIAAIVEGYKGEIAGFNAQVEERTAWWRSLTEEQKVKLGKNELEVEKAIAELKALVDSTISLNEIRSKIADTQGGLSAQVLASALGAFHTSLTHGTSNSANKSESWGHTDNTSESHTFDETKTS